MPSRRRRRALLPIRLILTILALASSSLLTAPAGATAASRIVVEIAPSATRLTDARLTRRLIALELADIDVPPPIGLELETHSLFFRVSVMSEETLRVELWELGRAYGARRVSARGSNHLRARRIALAAAELARGLLRRRRAEARRAAQEAESPGDEETEHAGVPVHARFAVTGGGTGAVVGPGDLWLLGPGLAADLRFAEGPRLHLGLAWLAGQAPVAAGAPSARWLEMSLAPSYALQFSEALGLDLGIQCALAAVHLAGVRSIDDTAGEADTWSARAVAFAHLEPRLGGIVSLSVGPEVGAVLRRIVVVDDASERHRLGGLWVGGRLGITVDP